MNPNPVRDVACIAEAVAAARAAGYVVIKEKSYRAAQERHRLAQAHLEWEASAAESARSWARDCLTEERQLRERCTYLYGLACKLGANERQLRGYDEDARKSSYLDTLTPVKHFNPTTREWDPV